MSARIQPGRRTPAFQPLDKRWPSFDSLAFSFLAHGAGVWMLFTVASFRYIPLRPQAAADPTGLEIQLQERTYHVTRLTLPTRGRTGPGGAAPSRSASGKSVKALHAAPRQAHAEAELKPAPRTFVPPELKRLPVAEETLIQPDSPPELRPIGADLPSFHAWSAQIPKIPKPFVAPGQQHATVEQPQLLAQPGFDVWRTESTSDKQAKLTLPVVRAPVDTPPVPQTPQLPSGDPVNVVSISDHPTPPTETLKVPPGNSVARGGGDPGAPVSGRLSGLGQSETPGADEANANSGASGNANANPGNGSGPLPGSGTAANRGSDLNAKGGDGASGHAGDKGGSKGSGDAKATGSAMADASGAAAANATAGKAGTGGAAGKPAVPDANARQQTVITRPANGAFDTVVIQSSPLDLFPEGRNQLSGRPVYTVYLAVGTAKDWTLYYCVPGNSSANAGSTGVVQLSNPAPVKAPWPTRIVRPNVKLPAYEKYALLHAYVTETGKFRDVRVVNPGTAETDQAILAAINDWQFRPADRDGVPVAVEILLAIPAVGI